MNGVQYIRLYTKRYSYELELRHKITIIRGDSATGKTTIIDTYNKITKKGAEASKSLRNLSTLKIFILRSGYDEDTVYLLMKITKESIIIIDEDFEYIKDKKFAKAINESDNYFVIINRDPLPGLSYAYDAINEIKTDSKNRHYLSPIYKASKGTTLKPFYIICEDSKNGFTFFKLIDTENNRVFTSKGKSNIVKVAKELHGEGKRNILVIADGAAIGPELSELLELQLKLGLTLYLPKSFEYILLNSIIFKDNEDVYNALHDTDIYINTEYISEERFYTEFLGNTLESYGITYSKSNLDRCFIDKCCIKDGQCGLIVYNRKISKLQYLLEQMPIDFSDIYIDNKLNPKVVIRGDNYRYIEDSGER